MNVFGWYYECSYQLNKLGDFNAVNKQTNYLYIKNYKIYLFNMIIWTYEKNWYIICFLHVSRNHNKAFLNIYIIMKIQTLLSVLFLYQSYSTHVFQKIVYLNFFQVFTFLDS